MAAKSPDAFRTISEVADWLDRPAHVLRFWESKFPQVKPVKRAGGRRYYRPDDMLLLGGIKKLLHDDGMTIKGVQKIMREQGIKYVSGMSQALDDAAPASEPDNDAVDAVATTAPRPSDTAPAIAPMRPAVAPTAEGPADAPDLRLVDDAPPPAAKDPVPPLTPVTPVTPAPLAQDLFSAQEPALPAAATPLAQTPPAPIPPVADNAPAGEAVPQDAAPTDMPAPLGADLPPPTETDTTQVEPGLLALLAARSHPIPARDRAALTPILAQIDALAARLVTARKG
ncbi:MAG: MerR family transcriptional regulator [Paracoccaceae bacterium]|nr:MerR family transcriptional regulator [Paracoccaceae bacterium]